MSWHSMRKHEIHAYTYVYLYVAPHFSDCIGASVFDSLIYQTISFHFCFGAKVILISTTSLNFYLLFRSTSLAVANTQLADM